MWKKFVDTTAAMMRDTEINAPLKIISSLVPIILSKTPVKIPGKAKFVVSIGHTFILILNLYKNSKLNH